MPRRPDHVVESMAASIADSVASSAADSMASFAAESIGAPAADSVCSPLAESVDRRGSSLLVGVVVLVGAIAVLAAAAGAFVAFGGGLADPTPQVSFTATLDASDGWPDGQRLRIVHEGGDAVPVDEVSLLVTVERTDAGAKLTDFPTRRLTAAHVDGTDVVDNGYAGVDGVLDAVHTDGRWERGDAASVRIAQEDVDLRAGDRVRVVVCHEPSNAALARLTVTASGE